jgi:hypothetical protein
MPDIKKRTLIAITLLLVFIPVLARAQEGGPPLDLRLRRLFGYGGIGQIEGSFSLSIADDSTLAQVDFLFNGQVVRTVTATPFEYRFNTGEFAPGVYTMTAQGTTTDGQVRESQSIQREFLSAEAAGEATSRILVPLVAVVLAITVASAVLPVVLGRKRVHRPGQYGAAGGAICPRCSNPYARRFWSPNLLAGKLERCPHCGKWAIVRRADPASLAAAEARLASEGETQLESSESEADRLQRLLDESRYES